MSISSTPSAGPAPLQNAEARLKKTAGQLEGLFVQRLFSAMRDTIPQDGLVPQGDGESTFTSLLDEKLAEQVPAQWTGQHSLAAALYKQLRRHLPEPEMPSPNASASTASLASPAAIALESK